MVYTPVHLESSLPTWIVVRVVLLQRSLCCVISSSRSRGSVEVDIRSATRSRVLQQNTTIMATTTLTGNGDNLSSSGFLNTSIRSLPSSRQGPSNVSKIYKQASTYFLTRRLRETLDTLQPLLIVQEDEGQTDQDGESSSSAPIAQASRSGRIKVWSVYLTILDEIVKLGPDEGKTIFGNQRWRDLVTMVQKGQIWEEISRIGYNGVEGDVDPEVVINL